MATASSTFATPAENPLSEGGVWTSGPGSMNAMRKTNGAARPATDTDSSGAGARYVGTSFGGDQYSKATCEGSAVDTIFWDVCTRIASNTDADCYYAELQGTAGQSVGWGKISDNGSALTYTRLGITGSVNASVPFTLELRSVATRHYVYANSTLIATFVDASYASGQPGINCTQNTVQDTFRDWEGGDYSLGSITYLGSSSTPADSATATGVADPTAVTPVSGLQAGDLVILFAHARIASLTEAISQASGQTWSSLTQRSTTTCSTRIFWCRFNGTWGANPSVSFGNVTCNTVVMHAYRPPRSTDAWAVDVTESYATHSGGTVSITGQTTTKGSTVTFAAWASIDDNTWSDQPTGAGWYTAGSFQYRNTSGSDQSCSFADRVQTSPGATGNVSKAQATLGPDAGGAHIVTFYAWSAFSAPLSESMAISESVAARLATARGVSESLAITESVAAARHAVVAAPEALAITEVVAAQRHAVVAPSEAMALVEALGARLGTGAAVSEGAVITEALVAQLATARAVGESLAITESVDARLATSAAVAESIAIGEAVDARLGAVAGVDEALALGEQLDAALAARAALSEAMTIGESGAVDTEGQVDVSEAMTIGESVTAVQASQGGPAVVELEEAMSIGEAITVVLVRKKRRRSIAHSEPRREREPQRHVVALAEMLVVGETLDSLAHARVGLREGLLVVEQLKAAGAAHAQLAEALRIDEEISGAGAHVAHLAEGLMIGEAIGTHAALVIAIGEQLRIAEAGIAQRFTPMPPWLKAWLKEEP